MEQGAGKVLELVVFELKQGATRDDLLATVDAVSAWIAEQRGFVSRELIEEAESGRWIDLVRWRTIDIDSTLMVHGVPVHAAGA